MTPAAVAGLVLQFAGPIVSQLISDWSAQQQSAAWRVVGPIVAEMLETAAEQGIDNAGRLRFEFRRTYTARMLDALQTLEGQS